MQFPIAGVPIIYSARPQDGRKMGCETKRLWTERAWGGMGIRANTRFALTNWIVAVGLILVFTLHSSFF